MKNGKKNKSSVKNGEEGMELSDVDINPLILDYMVRETFSMFDEDGSGDIDKNEFSKLTDALGLEMNEKKQAEIMRELDKEGSGCIDFDEFVNLMKRFQFGNAETHLESAFNEYDKDMDGEVGLNDLLKVSEELDEIPISKSDAELMIAFFKYFTLEKEKNVEEGAEDTELNFESIKNFNITKKDFLTTLTRINFLIPKVDNLNDPNKSRVSGYNDINKSGANSRIYGDKDRFERSDFGIGSQKGSNI